MGVVFLCLRRGRDRLLDRCAPQPYTLAVLTGGTDSDADRLDTGADLIQP
jgi:hypothetical protein